MPNHIVMSRRTDGHFCPGISSTPHKMDWNRLGHKLWNALFYVVYLAPKWCFVLSPLAIFIFFSVLENIPVSGWPHCAAICSNKNYAGVKCDLFKFDDGTNQCNFYSDMTR